MVVLQRFSKPSLFRKIPLVLVFSKVLPRFIREEMKNAKPAGNVSSPTMNPIMKVAAVDVKSAAQRVYPSEGLLSTTSKISIFNSNPEGPKGGASRKIGSTVRSQH